MQKRIDCKYECVYISLMVKQIIETLLAAGLTQTEISRRASVPQSRISDIANGNQSTISYEAGKRLEKLAYEINKTEST